MTNGKKQQTDTDLKSGITFSLIKDDFTKKHFDLALHTGLFGTAKPQSPEPEEPEEKAVNITMSGNVEVENIDLVGSNIEKIQQLNEPSQPEVSKETFIPQHSQFNSNT